MLCLKTFKNIRSINATDILVAVINLNTELTVKMFTAENFAVKVF